MMLLLGKLVEFDLIQLSAATEQTEQGQENPASPSLWAVEVGDPCLSGYCQQVCRCFALCWILTLLTDVRTTSYSV